MRSPALVALLGLLGACAPEPSAPTATAAPAAPASVPVYDGPGRELIGTEIAARLPPALEPPSLEPPSLEPVPLDAAARATLVRWWTDACPFCEHSLPALEALRLRHADAGLAALAVYHPKPPRAVEAQFARDAAARLGWNGPLALDPEWAALRGIWLDAAPRAATSVTFLLDRHGRVRWLHPGPELHDSAEPAHAACDAAFRALERAVEALLRED